MTTDAARKAVFNTSELLESILVCLPPKTLFGVQRVSKQFQAIIATSIPIQEKMFLRLRNKSHLNWQLKYKDTESGLAQEFVESVDPSADQDTRTTTELNPFLQLSYTYIPCATRARLGVSEYANLALARPISLNMLERKTPSILNTYISDPPPHGHITVSYNYQFPRGFIAVHQEMLGLQDGDGTIGDTIRSALNGDGEAMFGPHLSETELGPDWVELPHGAESHARALIEHYEQMSGPTAKLKRGIRSVGFDMYEMVVPTDNERAAVKSGGLQG